MSDLNVVSYSPAFTLWPATTRCSSDILTTLHDHLVAALAFHSPATTGSDAGVPGVLGEAGEHENDPPSEIDTHPWLVEPQRVYGFLANPLADAAPVVVGHILWLPRPIPQNSLDTVKWLLHCGEIIVISMLIQSWPNSVFNTSPATNSANQRRLGNA